MRILWVCNIMLPAVARHLNMEYSVREGWLTGLLSRMTKEGGKFETKVSNIELMSAKADKGCKNDITLGVCFPVQENRKDYQEQIAVDDFVLDCFGFQEDLNHPEHYEVALEKRFQDILSDFQPDLVHIFGTEFPHTLAMTRAFSHPDRILVGLQGIISSCGEVYYAGLPEKVIHQATFRDRLKKDSIRDQKKKFDRRGENEKQAMLGCGNVTGRTAFDRQMAEQMNAHAVYYDMKETMRPCFYYDKWELNYCRKHRIFFSQADYPLKGFHILLAALPWILIRYPDMEVVVAGNSIVNYRTIKDKLKISAYGRYLRSCIAEYELEEKVEFLGSLTAEEMKEQYLLCHTFVCASVLENSPNSVAEAMLLGTPVVASRVGGIPSMIEDEQDGLLFENKDGRALAECIIRLWGQDELAESLSVQARSRAMTVHDAETNYRRLLEIYRMIMKQEGHQS